MNQPQFPPHILMMQMASGYWLSQCIYVAAKLGIADYLKEQQRSCSELAAMTQTDASALYRLLRALAGVGIFCETAPQTFVLTPFAELLCSDHPRSLRAMVTMLGEPEHYVAWSKLLHSVQTGEPAFDHYFGQGIFEYFGQHPEAATVFEQAMNSFSANEVPAILSAYDFADLRTIVDVGGGYGELLGSILQKYPHSQGILFDEAYVVDHAAATLNKHGISDRCQAISGSFFDSVPAGGDAYLLKHIIHDWGDAQAIAILKNCQKVLPDHGKLLVFELVVPPGNYPSAAKMLDVNMLVMCPGGKERTAAEYDALFTKADLKISQIVPTAEDIHIIEARKA